MQQPPIMKPPVIKVFIPFIEWDEGDIMDIIDINLLFNCTKKKKKKIALTRWNELKSGHRLPFVFSSEAYHSSVNESTCHSLDGFINTQQARQERTITFVTWGEWIELSTVVSDYTARRKLF